MILNQFDSEEMKEVRKGHELKHMMTSPQAN